MPHEPGHNVEQNATYKVYGTNEDYSGLVVMIGGHPYSTVGGAYEGFSVQLYSPTDSVNTTPNQTNTNPVIRTFISRRVYYRQDGSSVPVGSELHEHQDGTIMLGHDPNNMGDVVTRTRPSQRRARTNTTRSGDIDFDTQTRTQTRTRTSTGGMGGGTMGGGSGGGGGY